MTPLNIFACPSCKEQLKPQQKSQYSFLSCRLCQLFTPVIQGIPLFTESGLFDDMLLQKMAKLTNKFSDKQRYERYLTDKYSRDFMEVYAAFQPFNESSRAIYPFIDYLQETLQKDDVIIDTWSRTGWSALLIASLFPEQDVISFWEGDNSVLGYAGYGYWFNETRRPKNLTIAFLAPEQDLPLIENSVSLIHGHDIMHRRPMEGYLSNLIQVINDNGVIILPHIHLSNSEPVPYFDRGGIIRHGAAYQEYCTQILHNTPWRVMVLSETEVFNAQRPVELKDATNSLEYNAMLVIANKQLFQKPLTETWLTKNTDNMSIIANPLLSICYFTKQVSLNAVGQPNQVPYLLERHPVYQRRLDKVLPKSISSLARDILIQSNNRLPLHEISKVLNIPIARVITEALVMAEQEIISLLPISVAALNLQNFHSNHHESIQKSFLTSFTNMLETNPLTSMTTIENEPVNAKELSFLVNAWRRYLQLKSNIKSVEIQGSKPLEIPFVMACWLESISVTTSNEQVSNEIQLFTQSINDNSTTISFSEEARNNYWRILEPFMADDELPLPNETSLSPAKVNTQPWYSWLAQNKNMSPF